MKKIVLMLLGLLTISMFLIGCAPAGEAIRPPPITPLPVTETIEKGDLFLLPVGVAAPTTTSTVGEILEYKGADKKAATNPKIKFKQWSTGETLEYAIRNNQATIRLGGKSFKVALISDEKDSPLKVDLNGDGTLDEGQKKVNNLHNLGAMGLRGLGYWCEEVATLLEGESISTTGGLHELRLMYVDNEKIKVEVDGTMSSFIELGKLDVVSDLRVHLLNILYQDYAGGVHQASLCLR